MRREFLILIAVVVTSLAASCGGGSGAPAPPAPGPSDTDGPAISVSGVTDGATVGGDVTITAAAADPSGVIDFDFDVNDVNVATESTGAMAFVWHTAGNGTDTLKFTATDAHGNTTTKLLSVTRFNGISWPPFPIIDPGLVFDPIPFPLPDPSPDPFPIDPGLGGGLGGGLGL